MADLLFVLGLFIIPSGDSFFFQPFWYLWW